MDVTDFKQTLVPVFDQPTVIVLRLIIICPEQTKTHRERSVANVANNIIINTGH